MTQKLPRKYIWSGVKEDEMKDIISVPEPFDLVLGTVLVAKEDKLEIASPV